MPDAEIARNKRAIDRFNQQRNDDCADALPAPVGITNFDTRCAQADGSATS